MKTKNFKKIIGFLTFAGVLSLSTLAVARPYRVRVIDPKVNTRAEARYDYNRNGVIGPVERLTMTKSRVNTRNEWRCDINRNGWIDTPRERVCKW